MRAYKHRSGINRIMIAVMLVIMLAIAAGMSQYDVWADSSSGGQNANQSVSYELPELHDLIPGRSGWFGPCVACVDNATGARQYLPITNAEVLGTAPAGITVKPDKDQNGNILGWIYSAGTETGTATLEIQYNDRAGQQKTGTISFDVKNEAIYYDLSLSSTDGNYQALPGHSISIKAVGIKKIERYIDGEYQYSDEKFTDVSDYKWEIRNGDGTAVQNNDFELSLGTDAGSASVKLRQKYTNEQQYNIESLVYVELMDGNTSVAKNWVGLTGSEDFYVLDHNWSESAISSLMEPGDSVTRQFRLLHVTPDHPNGEPAASGASGLSGVKFSMDANDVDVVAVQDANDPSKWEITRKTPWLCDFQLSAKWQENNVPREDRINFHFDGLEYSVSFSGGEGNLYSDSDTELKYRINVPAGSKSRVRFELGIGEWDNGIWKWTKKFTEGTEYTINDSSNTITLIGNEISKLITDDNGVDLHAAAYIVNGDGSDEVTIADSWTDRIIRKPLEYYDEMEYDQVLLSRRSEIDIGQVSSVYVLNSMHPNGGFQHYKVTDVKVLTQTPDEVGGSVVSAPELRIEKNGELLWVIEALDPGIAKIQVTYEVYNDKELSGAPLRTESYTFNASVALETYEVHISGLGGGHIGVPGEIFNFEAYAICSRTDESDTSDGITYKWEIVNGGRYAEFIDDSGNRITAPETANISVRFLNPDSVAELNEEVEIKVTAYKGVDANNAPIARADDSVHLEVRDHNFNIVLKGEDGTPVDLQKLRTLGVNEPLKVTPELRRYPSDNAAGYDVINASGYEIFDWKWNYNPYDIKVTDKDGNVVGGEYENTYTGSTAPQEFTITRLNGNDRWLDLCIELKSIGINDFTDYLEEYYLEGIEEAEDDNPGGGGSGGSGTSGDGTSETPQPVPVAGSDSPVEISAVIDEGVAVISPIGAEDLSKVEEGARISMDLASKAAAGEDVTAVVIPTETVKNMAASKAEGVEIKLDSAEVFIDQATLEAVSEQAKGAEIRFVVEPTGNTAASLTDGQKRAIEKMKNAIVIDAYFESAGTRISDFNGGEVEIRVPYESNKPVRVWFVNETGSLVEIPSSYDTAKKVITFRVTHFSKYAIEQYELKANTMTVKAVKKGVTVKASKLKKAKSRIALKKLLTVKKAKGTVTFKKVSVNKRSGNFKVDAKTGKVTIKKGTKKGTYSIRIKVTAAGAGDYKPISRTVTCKIRIK